MHRESTSWRESVDRFARPDLGRSLLALATSVVPFLGLWVLMYLALQVSYLLVLALDGAGEEVIARIGRDTDLRPGAAAAIALDTAAVHLFDPATTRAIAPP